MIPNDLPAREIKLQHKNGGKIVIFTGTSLRHDRFALRIQQEFGEKVIGWFQCLPKLSHSPDKRLSSHRKLFNILKKLTHQPSKISQLPKKIINYFNNRSKFKSLEMVESMVESNLFNDEVTILKKNAHIKPELIIDPNKSDFVERVRSLKPYLILTLGGTMYSNALLETASGIAINQHDGWCPEYRGTRAVNWTLYHRKLSKIGNTVHLLTSGMDSGPILRRSSACLVPEDSSVSCFLRAVALGTELMLECVVSVLNSESIIVYDQKPKDGYTYLTSHYRPEIKEAIERDIKNGIIATEINRQTNF